MQKNLNVERMKFFPNMKYWAENKTKHKARETALSFDGVLDLAFCLNFNISPGGLLKSKKANEKETELKSRNVLISFLV